MNATASANQLRGEAGGGDNRGLLHDHRHDAVSIVDEEVGAEPDGEMKDAERVLDHAIGRALIQTGLAGEMLDQFEVDTNAPREQIAALSERESVEAREQAVHPRSRPFCPCS